MSRAVGVFKMHYRDKLSWFYLPWGIMACSFIVNFIIAYFIQESSTEGHITGGILSIFIYLLIIGIALFPQTFPFVLSYSVRRKDYFWGTTAMITLVSIITSILLVLLGVVESHVIEGWGVNMAFFDLPYLSDGNVLQQAWVMFSLFMNLFFMGFAIACFYRSTGRTGMIVSGCILLIVGSLGSYLMSVNGGWILLFEWFVKYSLAQHAVWLFGLAVIYAVLSYLMVRRSVA